ncbi:site-specific recombinase XerD [Ereboglobus sp. PH5-10]|uniref:tyrosine-type recombinase/integrase n=1 Tax=Ereboglobus sp. PH5-10 TaxID=2940629 RepID=UPI0024066CF0|nr:hypothetical protein [Ereboglobus sp. PH5-10]MDF9827941.1 site-specific recombinase XerD [Ereboglobus sp. PH5-10]
MHWTDRESGRREATGFKDAAAREVAARDLAEKREKHGTDVLAFDPKRWARYLDFQKLVGDETDPIIVAHEWLAYRQGIGKGGAQSLTVREAYVKYRAIRETEEKLSADTWRHIDKHVGIRFCNDYGDKKLNELEADDIRRWLAKLTNPKTGEPMEAQTKKHHRKDVNTFLDRTRKEGWILRNPCEIVAVPEVDDGDVVVISPEDAFKFFKANLHEPVAGRIALEAFGGLRYSSAGRIQKAHLSFEEKGIEMPGSLHKSGKRKWRQGHPDVLWAWLAHAPEACWSMTFLNYREWKRAALIRAGLRPLAAATDDDKETLRGLRNVWRHSFASYMLAHTKNMPSVGYLMQHTSTKTTEVYEGVATEANAKLYLAMTPQAVAAAKDWDAFKKAVAAQTAAVQTAPDTATTSPSSAAGKTPAAKTTAASKPARAAKKSS